MLDPRVRELNKTCSARRYQFMGERFRVTIRGFRTKAGQDVGIMKGRESGGFTEMAGAQTPEGRAVFYQVARGEENRQRWWYRQRQTEVSPSYA